MREGLVLSYLAVAVIVGFYHLWDSYRNAGIHDDPSAEMSGFMGLFWLPMLIGVTALFVYIRISDARATK